MPASPLESLNQEKQIPHEFPISDNKAFALALEKDSEASVRKVKATLADKRAEYISSSAYLIAGLVATALMFKFLGADARFMAEILVPVSAGLMILLFALLEGSIYSEKVHGKEYYEKIANENEVIGSLPQEKVLPILDKCIEDAQFMTHFLSFLSKDSTSPLESLLKASSPNEAESPHTPKTPEQVVHSFIKMLKMSGLAKDYSYDVSEDLLPERVTILEEILAVCKERNLSLEDTKKFFQIFIDVIDLILGKQKKAVVNLALTLGGGEFTDDSESEENKPERETEQKSSGQ